MQQRVAHRDYLRICCDSECDDSGTWRPFVSHYTGSLARRCVSHDADEVSHLQVHAIEAARLGAQL